MPRCIFISLILCAAAFFASCGKSIHDGKSFETNKPPVVAFDLVYSGNNPDYAVGSSKLAPGLIYNVVVRAKDPEGESLTYDLTAEHGTLGTLVKNADGATSVFVVGKITENDTATVSLTVRDRKNGLFSQKIDVGTGKKSPSVSASSPSKYQAPAAADNTFEFSFDCDGYYHLYCDNSIVAEDQAVLGTSVVRYKASSGKVPVTVVGPASTAVPSGVAVKLASANAANRIWLVFEDALGQQSKTGFTVVVEGTNPSVSSTSPAASAVKVSLSPAVTVFFSKAMNPDTLTNAFTMKAGTVQVPLAAPVYDSAAHTASFRPAAVLAKNTVYTVTVSRTAADDIGTTGNAMLADYSFSFTTVPDGYLSAPECSPAPGAYAGAQTVTVSSAEGASIAYTLDGSAPTASSTLYASPISVSADTVISAIAFKAGFVSSDVCVNRYRIKPGPPVFSLAEGTYTGTQTLTLTAPDASAEIFYTTDGSAPSASSGTIPSGGSIDVDRNMTLCAIARVPGLSLDSDATSAVYCIRLAPPAFSEEGGTCGADRTIYLTAAAGATIWYTLDGSDSLNSPTRIAYSAGISAAGNGITVRIRACAEKTGYTQSEAAEETYTINYGAVESPQIFIDGDTKTFAFTEEKIAVITCATPGASIRYKRTWTGGGDANWNEGAADTPVYVAVDRSMTVTACAAKSGLDQSGPVSPSYTLTVPDPIADTTSGVLTITSAPGSKVYYTTDGSAPTESGTLYTSPLNIGTSVIRARAYRDGWTPSAAVKGGKLVGEWLFDGNTNDTSGTGANGVLSASAPTLVAGHNGSGNAYRFATGQTITAANSVFNISKGSPFSISLWFNADNASCMYFSYVMSNTGSVGDFNYFLTIMNSTMSPTIGQNGYSPSCSSFSVVSGVWYHVVMMYDGTNVMTYVTDESGGMQIGKVPYASNASVTTSTTPVIFGGAASHEFSGVIDDVRFYSRVLSEDEIRALYKM